MAINDRRRYPRFPTELEVQYGVGPDLVTGRIVDIGVAGLGIVGENTYPAGSKVELRFRAPDTNEDLRIKAVVCFSNPHRMGVQVISVPAKDAGLLEKIYEVLSRNLP